ncbi:MAG: PTS sugar transporter subunit IIA [Verrucomicrobiota bacterium]|nr:PTS sugar transporter subunit IIA [Verrucomicrobiota bacterium]
MILFLDVETREEAIDALVNCFDATGRLPSKEAFRAAVFYREKLVSTGIGVGVAIPHAKIKSCTQFSIAIGIQRQKGIEWESIDLSPVRLIFLIGGPEDRQSDYLQLLSQLTSAVKNIEVRKALLKATHVDQVLELFSGY